MPAAGAKRPRILLPTIRTGGGVGTMQAAVATCLEATGADVTLAYYQPYRLSPDLSVPFWRLLQRRPQRRKSVDRNGRSCVEIGAWLPEIEAMRYRATRLWRETLKEFDASVAVCGTIFAARPLIDLGLPAVIWVATPYDPDRRARAHHFGWHRRLFDRLIDAPLCRSTERRLLQSAPLFTISHYTKRELLRLAPEGDFRVMPIPVDSDFFSPGDRQPPMGRKDLRIGLVGRLDDPRKNPDLLLQAAALLAHRGHSFKLVLIGGARADVLQAKVNDLGLAAQVEFQANLTREQLRDAYRSFDVLAITSDQEGLGLVGLEALACGASVVSTRCGGPEDYVRDGETGLLVDKDPADLAKALERLIANPDLAQRLARAGRDLVLRHHSLSVFSKTLSGAIRSIQGIELQKAGERRAMQQ